MYFMYLFLMGMGQLGVVGCMKFLFPFISRYLKKTSCVQEEYLNKLSQVTENVTKNIPDT